MPGKKRKQLSSKQIIMITLTILGVGMLMLVASILLAPGAESSGSVQKTVQDEVQISQTQQSDGQSSWGVDVNAEMSETQKPAQQSSAGQSSGTSPSSQNSSTNAQKPVQQSATTQSRNTDVVTINVKPENQTGSQASQSFSSNGADAAQAQAAQSSTAQSLSALANPSSGSKLVFVFDDAGHNLTQLEPFLNLPFKADIAVLPSLPHSADAAAAIRKAGKEVMLHQPMQAVNLSVDPGPSAITPDMHTYEIEELVRKNIAEIGPIKGLNNHEGSLITATQSAIGAVLDVCKEEGIFFLDSRTNSETKAPQAAQERGMTIYERDIFLDNSQDKSDIIAMIEKGLAVADKKGHAIMIGHVWSDGLAAILEELYPELVARGYVFTDISGLK